MYWTKNSDFELGFKFDDDEINVDWKVKNPIISERDQKAKSFKEMKL